MLVYPVQMTVMAATLKTMPLCEPVPSESETILVVDDSRAQRRLLSASLGRWGYTVIEAGSGEEALEICKEQSPDLILSDWMMPGMGGLGLCRAYKELRGDRYGYFILLTSKSEKNEIAQGLEVGADDFLTKPFSAPELRARIQAGERVLRMEQELTEKNRLVSSTLAELQVLYDAVDRDLLEARKLQQSLVQDRFRRYDGADLSLLLHPAGRVGGDLVGAFKVNDTELGLFSIDVSGHGIASALLTARLAGFLTGTSPKQNLAIRLNDAGELEMRSPAAVVETLNRMILEELDTEHYFTIILANLNLATGNVKMTQAGHPHPAVHRACGIVEFPGAGGLPVGLIEGAEFTEFETKLNPGDRLFLGSDGITECAAPDGDMLEDDGLTRLLLKNTQLEGPQFFDAFIWDLTEFSGDQDFADDVSGVLVDFKGR